jgi:hypothetical protein
MMIGGSAAAAVAQILPWSLFLKIQCTAGAKDTQGKVRIS